MNQASRLVRRSFFEKVPMGPPDAILGITEAFKADPHPQKINLGVGAYRDDAGKPFVLESVKRAEVKMAELYKDKEYTGIAGIPEFTKVSAELAFGNENEALSSNRVAVCQSISGTGALRIGTEFLSRFFPNESKEIYLPSPTWGNHIPISVDSGLKVKTYRYFDPKTNGLDFEGMKEDISNAPKESIILLHACAHNPTGVDPKPEQWAELSQILLRQDHLPFFDMAYQGFASGDPTKDAAAVRSFVADGHLPLVAQSYAKNFGLYGERVGALSVVCKDAEEKARVESRLKIVVRPMYSNPPIHGARIVTTVLKDVQLKDLWSSEVRGMANRIISMRKALKKELESLGSSRDWSHITDQIGMFCYTGLNVEQVASLTRDHHVYLTKDGRISIAGINAGNVSYLANAMHQVTK